MRSHLDSHLLPGLQKGCGTVDLDCLVRDGEGDGAALSAFVGAVDGEPLDVQMLTPTGVVPDCLDVVQHRRGPAGPGRPLFPVRDHVAQILEGEVAFGFG